MSAREPVNKRVRRLITGPGHEIGRLARFLEFQAQLWQVCARRLNQNNLLALAAALSFGTIFALIPTLVLGLLVAGSLGVLEDSKRSLRDLLSATGFTQIAAMPEAETVAAQTAGGPPAEIKVINVAEEIERIVERVRNQLTFARIGPIGAALFIWSALSLLTTMEDALNRVFGAPRNRSIARRVLLYWSTMTLGPVALACANFFANKAIAAVQDMPGAAWLIVPLGWIGPILVGVLVLAAIYILLPNTSVNLNTAIGGAFVAVLAWLVARWGFALYVKNYVVSGNLYGILGLLPLFMMWLYFSWMIFLFGAELAHTAANWERLKQEKVSEAHVVGPADALATALAIAQSFESAGGPVPLDRLQQQLNMPAESLHWLLERLSAQGAICGVNGEGTHRYVLARPPERIDVSEVLRVASAPNPPADAAQTPNGVRAMVQDVARRLDAAVADLTLADLLRKEKA